MKAVLVLPEMPESCEECPFCRHDTLEQLGCSTQSHVINIILRMVGQKKPRWCPLRMLPNRESQISLEEVYSGEIPATIKDLIAIGHDQCLDEIEGSEKENVSGKCRNNR